MDASHISRFALQKTATLVFYVLCPPPPHSLYYDSTVTHLMPTESQQGLCVKLYRSEPGFFPPHLFKKNIHFKKGKKHSSLMVVSCALFCVPDRTTQPTWWKTWRVCTERLASTAKAPASSSLTTKSKTSPSWSTWTMSCHLERSESTYENTFLFVHKTRCRRISKPKSPSIRMLSLKCIDRDKEMLFASPLMVTVFVLLEVCLLPSLRIQKMPSRWS